jgi:hypothetical protein|uniref:Dit-like phage tail protein N-terminal domain-containing protein n=1 Tax=Myoviridae sp. ct5xZ3 TaxID=2827601 RepID=A0A8S5RRQ8_9CAUD|nr:MAG TPA: hypothetical protein [Myoviridae sp. ct5xZ3]
MARNKLKPTTIAGIEFDALIDDTKTMSATIPTYPVEDGFPVSDTIILDPLSLQMTLYVTNTPVTWLYKHGDSTSRVNNICNELENFWLSRKLTKIVTTDAIYTNMGITNISIKHSKEIGYAREISIAAQKVRMTQKKTVTIPKYILKSGKTKASAGTASTSKTSKSSSSSSNSSSKSGASSSSGSSGKKPDAKKKHSILYGAASGLGFI